MRDPLELPDRLDLAKPAPLAEKLGSWNTLLAGQRTIPDSLRTAVRGLVDLILEVPREDRAQIDRDLVESLQEGALGASKALALEEPADARRELRIRLEQVRQALEVMEDENAVREDRPIKDVIRWLVRVLNAPQTRVADILDTKTRTLQRWISETGEYEPRGSDAGRVRTVARLANNLRHTLTGEGVLDWLREPNPRLDGRAPASLLDDPDAVPRLLRLARDSRSGAAS